jgi:hypothetical protein
MIPVLAYLRMVPGGKVRRKRVLADAVYRWLKDNGVEAKGYRHCYYAISSIPRSLLRARVEGAHYVISLTKRGRGVMDATVPAWVRGDGPFGGMTRDGLRLPLRPDPSTWPKSAKRLTQVPRSKWRYRLLPLKWPSECPA